MVKNCLVKLAANWSPFSALLTLELLLNDTVELELLPPPFNTSLIMSLICLSSKISKCEQYFVTF